MRASLVSVALEFEPNRRLAWVSVIVPLLVLVGCTHTVDLNERPDPPATSPDAGVQMRVGVFRDDRGIPQTRLGQIRGLFGEPGRRIETDKPVYEVVEEAFREELKSRSMLADPSGAEFELRGFVKKFDCNQLVRREAHAVVGVAVVTTSDGQPVFEETYRADAAEWHARPWYLGATKDVQGLAERVLQEVVVKAASDWRLVSALESTPQAPLGDPEERLELLRSLRDRGYLTGAEYDEKRRGIIDGL